MQADYAATGAPEPLSPTRAPSALRHGLILALAITFVAYPVGRIEPVLGAPLLALVLGIAAATVKPPGDSAAPGLRFASKQLLQAGVVSLGATLRLGQLERVGSSAVPVMLGTLAAALIVAFFAGRALHVEPRLRTLIGIGTGICGASAIAAVSGIVEATTVEITYAISTIFVFNLVAVITFPGLGHLLGLSQSGFGLWAGTAVNDTSSVIAAAYAYGHVAGTHAVVVKLTRTTMIIPVVALLALAKRRERSSGARMRWRKTIPWFLVWFLCAVSLDTAVALPTPAIHALQQASTVLIAAALGAVGLSTRLATLRAAGSRPILFGALVWAAVATTSLALQSLTGLI